MGEFRFRIPDDWDLGSYHANSIHVLGLDGIPWPCRIASVVPSGDSTERVLSVTRNNENSGRLYTHFPFKERGELLICTGTLPIREKPFDLLTELARGTVNRLRNQLSIWEEGGLRLNEDVHQQVSEATQYLSKAIMSAEPKQSDEFAKSSIETAMNAIFKLSIEFGEQISKFRREHDQLSNFWMAGLATNRDQYQAITNCSAFDLAQISVSPNADGKHEWLNQPREQGSQSGNFEQLGLEPPSPSKRLIVGPWVDASVGGLPSRLIDLEDFPVRKNQLINELRDDLQKLPSETSLLHIVSGLNGIGHKHLSHPQQLQLTVDMLRLVEESRIEIPTMVSFDFPWAERLAGAVGGVHPLQIADSLLRQGLEISILGLEINLDYWPNGSAVRDPLQWIDLVDVWAQLGMPLVLFLRVPFGESPDAPLTSQDRHINRSPSNLNDKNRLDFLTYVLPMMMARPAVYGVVWQQWTDADDSRYPSAGLTAQGEMKPVVGELLGNLKQYVSGP